MQEGREDSPGVIRTLLACCSRTRVFLTRRLPTGYRLLDRHWRNRLSRAAVPGLLAAVSIGLAVWVWTGSTPAPANRTDPAAVEVDASPPAAAPPPQPAIDDDNPRPDPDLARKIDALLDSKRYRRASWGVDVRYVDGGAVLYSRNPLKYFIPASNVKVFTTAAVLDRLGPDFRFETRLGYEGQLQENGVLTGDLVLIGGGDPGLANSPGSGSIFQHLDNMGPGKWNGPASA